MLLVSEMHLLGDLARLREPSLIEKDMLEVRDIGGRQAPVTAAAQHMAEVAEILGAKPLNTLARPLTLSLHVRGRLSCSLCNASTTASSSALRSTA